MNFTIGVIAIAITAVPALVGRTIQILHYHSLSAEKREKPEITYVKGLKVGFSKENNNSEYWAIDLSKIMIQESKFCQNQLYHGTNVRNGALRWGFDPQKSQNYIIGSGAYMTTNLTYAGNYGGTQIQTSLNLKNNEMIHINGLKISIRDSTDKETKTAQKVRRFFLLNGYRAAKFIHSGFYDCYAVYDPSCISITKIHQNNQILQNRYTPYSDSNPRAEAVSK